MRENKGERRDWERMRENKGEKQRENKRE